MDSLNFFLGQQKRIFKNLAAPACLCGLLLPVTAANQLMFRFFRPTTADKIAEQLTPCSCFHAVQGIRRDALMTICSCRNTGKSKTEKAKSQEDGEDEDEEEDAAPECCLARSPFPSCPPEQKTKKEKEREEKETRKGGWNDDAPELFFFILAILLPPNSPNCCQLVQRRGPPLHLGLRRRKSSEEEEESLDRTTASSLSM